MGLVIGPKNAPSGPR
jgi:hypothetical protein